MPSDKQLEPRRVVLRSFREAQNAPTPYSVFSVIHDGTALSDHQISKTRFRNAMQQQLTAGIGGRTRSTGTR